MSLPSEQPNRRDHRGLQPEERLARRDAILDAVAAQVAPDSHAYTAGEFNRLARPILFMSWAYKDKPEIELRAPEDVRVVE